MWITKNGDIAIKIWILGWSAWITTNSIVCVHMSSFKISCIRLVKKSFKYGVYPNVYTALYILIVGKARRSIVSSDGLSFTKCSYQHTFVYCRSGANSTNTAEIRLRNCIVDTSIFYNGCNSISVLELFNWTTIEFKASVRDFILLFYVVLA